MVYDWKVDANETATGGASRSVSSVLLVWGLVVVGYHPKCLRNRHKFRVRLQQWSFHSFVKPYGPVYLSWHLRFFLIQGDCDCCLCPSDIGDIKVIVDDFFLLYQCFLYSGFCNFNYECCWMDAWVSVSIILPPPFLELKLVSYHVSYHPRFPSAYF